MSDVPRALRCLEGHNKIGGSEREVTIFGGADHTEEYEIGPNKVSLVTFTENPISPNLLI